jgi:hypothetical protein
MNPRIVLASCLLLGFAAAHSADEPRADKGVVESILSEIEAVPSLDVRDEKPVKFESLPAFAASRLADFASDKDRSFEKQHADWKADRAVYAKQHPLRASLFAAIDVSARRKFNLRMTVEPASLPLNKVAFLQRDPAMSILDMEELLEEMKEKAEHRGKEKSLRWRADFDFARARLMGNYVLVFEYNHAIGQIRTDSLPELTKGQSGWQIVPSQRLTVFETKVKATAKERTRLLRAIERDYAGTPWAYFAEREIQRSLGLMWAVKTD